MKKQKRIIGSIAKIDLKNGKYAYSRILDKANYAIYDFLTDNGIIDLNLIVTKPILFIVAGYNDIITNGKWRIIGCLPLKEDLLRLPLKFKQDLLSPNIFELYDPNTGKTKPCSREECIGLERAAVWEAEHIEERIKDYYEGKPNKWLELMKLK